MKKIIKCLVLINIILLFVTTICGNQIVYAEDNIKDYEYKISGNNAIITKYTGTESEVHIPEYINNYKVTEIDKFAFYYNQQIKKVYMSQYIVKIGWASFSNCENIENVYFNEGLIEIDSSAFSDCYSLSQMELPDSLVKIQDSAFFNTGLSEAIIPENVYILGDFSFGSCSLLESVIFKGGGYINLNGGFEDCINLKNVIFEDENKIVSVRGLGKNNLFKNCISLEKIKLPKGLDNPFYIFKDCVNLKEVFIPSNISESDFPLNNYFIDAKNIEISGFENSYAKEYAEYFNLPFRNLGKTASKIYGFDGMKSDNDSNYDRILYLELGEIYNLNYRFDIETEDTAFIRTWGNNLKIKNNQIKAVMPGEASILIKIGYANYNIKVIIKENIDVKCKILNYNDPIYASDANENYSYQFNLESNEKIEEIFPIKWYSDDLENAKQINIEESDYGNSCFSYFKFNKPGQYKITAVSRNNQRYETVVTVKEKDHYLILDKYDMDIFVGEKDKLNIKFSSYQNDIITWDSSDSSVVDVDGEGNIYAKKEGTAIIIAKSLSGITAECIVKVSDLKSSISYQTHIQGIGWQNWKVNGEMSGTSGQSKRLEGINIKLSDAMGGIEYQTHIQGIGWQDWKANGEMSGTSGQSKRLEAIRIRLTGKIAEEYDVYYRVHAQQFGWLDWAKNGESAGTATYGYRLEGIEVKLVRKGETAPGDTTTPYHTRNISYQTHVQRVGWQENKYDGETSGTNGQSLRLEGIKIGLSDPQYSGGVEYQTHVQTYGWQNWKNNGAMSGTSGESKRLEAIRIRLTGEMAEKYDVYYRVHAQQFGWMGWAKNGEDAGSAGYSYRLEGIQIQLVPKGASAPGSIDNAFKEK